MADFTIEELEKASAFCDEQRKKYLSEGYSDLSAEARGKRDMYLNAYDLAQQLYETLKMLEASQAENVALQARIDAALAIEERELSLDDYQRTFNEFNRGANDMRAQFRKTLGGK